MLNSRPVELKGLSVLLKDFVFQHFMEGREQALPFKHHAKKRLLCSVHNMSQCQVSLTKEASCPMRNRSST